MLSDSDSIKKDIELSIEKTKEKLIRNQRELEQIGKLLDENKNHFGKVIKNIQLHNEELKQKHDTIADEQVKSCKEHERANELELYKWKLYYERLERNSKSKIDQYNSLGLTDLCDIQAAKNLIGGDDPEEDPPAVSRLVWTARFHVDSDVDNCPLESLHGHLASTEYRPHSGGYSHLTLAHGQESASIPAYDLNNIETVSTFKHSANISCIALTSTNEAWISTGNRSDKAISRVNQEGELKQTLPYSHHHIQFSDLSLCSDGSLWVCSTDRKAIMKLEQLHFNTKLHIETKEQPFRFCVSTDNDTIYVCFENKIQAFSSKGKILRTTPTGNNIKPLGTVKTPFRIRENPVTGELAVCDRGDYLTRGTELPSVLVMDKNFYEKFKYYGENAHSPFKPQTSPRQRRRMAPKFEPVDVCFQNRGHLLIADKIKKSILLVSKEGIYIATLDVSTTEPTAISMRDGHVWIGYANRSVKIMAFHLDERRDLAPSPPETSATPTPSPPPDACLKDSKSYTRSRWYDGMFDLFRAIRDYYTDAQI